MKRALFLPILFSLFILSTPAEGPLDMFANTGLKISIVTRVLEEDQSVVWNVESSEITVSGETVSLKLNGQNIIILAELTPYLLDDGSILLVAKGDVLLSDDEEGFQYKTTLKSLPVHLGEKVFFFPLGVAFDSEENIYTIQLEIQVDEVIVSREESLPRS